MRTGLKWILAGLFSAAVGLSGALADATTMLFLSRDELVARSALVVRVEVGKAVTAPSADGTTVLTTTEVNVLDYLKGSGGKTLQIEQMGGTLNGKTLYVPGDGRLVPGEQALLFLSTDGAGKVHLSVLAQSVYHVGADGLARRDLKDATFLRRKEGKLVHVEPQEAAEPIDSLVADVVRIAGGKK